MPFQIEDNLIDQIHSTKARLDIGCTGWRRDVTHVAVVVVAGTPGSAVHMGNADSL